MKWFMNLKISKKLLLGFISIYVLAAIIGVFGIVQTSELQENDLAMFNKLNAPMVYMTNLTESFYKMRMTLYDAITAEEEGILGLKTESAVTLKGSIVSINNKLFNLYENSETVDINMYKTAADKLLPMVDEVIVSLQAHDTVSASAQFKSSAMDSAFSDVARHINTLITANISDAKHQADTNEKIAKNSKAVFIAIQLFCLISAISLGVFISLMISKPIKKLTVAAEKLAMGEVDVFVEQNSKDEVGILSKAFNKMISNINEQAAAAEKMANGDLNIKIEPRSENDVLSNSMMLFISTLNDLTKEISYIINELRNENYKANGDAGKFNGIYKEIVEGVNLAVNAVSEKVFWYEELLDSIPFPITVTDLNMNLTFINKAAEKLLGAKKEMVIGKTCGKFLNSEICGTSQCAMVKLKNSESGVISSFIKENKNYQVDSSYVYDSNGNKVGHIEVLQDITAKSRAVEYQKQEVNKLANNLRLLAEGDLKLDLEVSEGDEYTIGEREIFEEINENVSIAVEAISKYIKDITNILNQMASGNLDVSTNTEYKGDFIEIKDSLIAIIDSFNEIVNEINRSADQISIGARQVSDGSQALSQGTTEQASSIEQLTASITEVASQTKQNALSANEANGLALNAKNTADIGEAQMREMLVSMEEINEACKNISKIIKVIDEIAFQTNILALNASVEAARAGQHGKGFAVVAEEVRNLAVRSATAAKETSALIEDSLNIVKSGSKKANDTSNSLKTVVGVIQQASDIVDNIAKASDEQANAIAQINKGIEQVSKVVQNNSSNAEQGAAASEELASHAATLKELVDKFIINKYQNASGESEAEYVLEEDIEESIDVDENEIENTEVKLGNMLKIDLGEEDYGKY